MTNDQTDSSREAEEDFAGKPPAATSSRSERIDRSIPVPDDWQRFPDDREWWREDREWWREDRWRCLRFGPVSGRYRGEMTDPTAGRYELELRVDIDPRHSNSPVMDRISGDVFQKYQFTFRGRTYEWRVYRESWIVDDPSASWHDCYVDIKGSVRYWEGTHPSTRIGIRIPWGSLASAGPAEVTFWESGSSTPERYNCKRESSAFRDMALEVDVVESANSPPILPEYDTHSHNTRPSGLPQRTLTVEESFLEAGIDVTVNPDHTIIDDSAPEFDTWSVAELHDAMETHFSQYTGGWPKWHMWGLLASEFDNSGVAGIMFDARASFGGAGEPPERQGFAVFGDHPWFSDLPAGAPGNQAEAAAMRQSLYTWVHEAGHAFNFLHSWDKNRPNSLSWMNYPHRMSNFWDDFELRFDDQELIHMRHGNRDAVIMGGDAWATGGHMEGELEVPVDRMSPVEGESPVELLVRSSEYFDFLEPVRIELRLRNLMDEQSIDLDRRLHPNFGNVSLFIRNPDDEVVRYKPVIHVMGDPETITLNALGRASEGEDRYSEEIYVGHGKDGSYFAQPGEYQVRAAYQDQDDLHVVSNTHTFRVGAPQTREEDRLAHDVFSPEVGLCLNFDGSRSPYLEHGMEVLEELTEEFDESLVGGKAAATMANGLKDPFFSVREGAVLDAMPEEALEYTEIAKNLYQQRADPTLNIQYNGLMRTRAELLQRMDESDQAREELGRLRDDLKDRGVNQPVLEDITAFSESM